MSENINEKIQLRKERDKRIAEQEKLKDGLNKNLNRQLQSFVTFENLMVKRPSHWQVEYPEVFDQGGFNVVIANPPY